jgi:hypothetical protein
MQQHQPLVAADIQDCFCAAGDLGLVEVCCLMLCLSLLLGVPLSTGGGFQ